MRFDWLESASFCASSGISVIGGRFPSETELVTIPLCQYPALRSAGRGRRWSGKSRASGSSVSRHSGCEAQAASRRAHGSSCLRSVHREPEWSARRPPCRPKPAFHPSRRSNGTSSQPVIGHRLRCPAWLMRRTARCCAAAASGARTVHPLCSKQTLVWLDIVASVPTHLTDTKCSDADDRLR